MSYPSVHSKCNWLQNNLSRIISRSFASNANDFLPRIQPRSYFSQLRLQEKLKPGKIILPKEFKVHQLLSYDLVTSWNQEKPEENPNANHFQLSALKNLENQMKDSSLQKLEGEGNAYAIFNKKGAANFILSLDKLIQKSNIKLEGEPVVFTPTQDSLIVVGNKDESAWEVVRMKMQELGDSQPNNTLSRTGFIFNDSKWQPFFPDHEKYPRFHNVFARMHHLQMNKEHSAQEEILQNLLGKEPLIGTYFAYSLNMANYPKKFAALTEVEVGEDTVIPEVEYVFVIHNDEKTSSLYVVLWKKFVEGLKDKLQPVFSELELFPKRYRVKIESLSSIENFADHKIIKQIQ